MKGKQKWRIHSVTTFPSLKIEILRNDGSREWFPVSKKLEKELDDIFNYEWRHAMTMPKNFIRR